jgi:hypothetical protein
MGYDIRPDSMNCSLGHIVNLLHTSSSSFTTEQKAHARAEAYQNLLSRMLGYPHFSIFIFSDNLSEQKIKDGRGGIMLSRFILEEGLGDIVESHPGPSSHGALSPPIKAWCWNPDWKIIQNRAQSKDYWKQLEKKYAEQINSISQDNRGKHPEPVHQDVHPRQPVKEVPKPQSQAGRAATGTGGVGFNIFRVDTTGWTF